MNKYIEIDFNKVKGYQNLTEQAKEIFQKVYKVHNSSQGIDYKERYIPQSVKEHKEYLEVHFKGGEWLHYLPNGTWY